MRLIKFVLGLAVAVTLTACGGGGGSPGSTTNSGVVAGGSTSTSGDSQVTSSGSMTIDVLSAAASTSSISALEIAQAKVVLKNAAGQPAKGIIVTFSEIGGGLLTMAPASKTALTDDDGQASIEIRATTSTSIGATQVGATASVAGQSVSAQKAIEISSAPASGTVVDPQVLANAINFLDVNPADKSIVLAGSGGNGRSESATLRFRVVDKNNTPVKGTAVDFSVVPPNDVTLNIPSAVSDSDGVVITTVSSKTVATSVVVKALVTGKTISTQSDQLLVTTGIVTQGGFDLSASKFNMNFGITGDSSIITVRIVDANGNPVADGVPVVFTTNFGAVGTSSKGGCTTLNGACDVTYSVQDPRPTDGVPATVIASTRIGDGTEVSDSLEFIISNLSLVNLYDAATGGSIITTFNAPPGTCKFTLSAFVGTAAGSPAPAGTTIEVKGITTDFSGTVKTGSPVLDLTTARTPVSFEFDASNGSLVPACNTAGFGAATAQVEVKFTAGTRVNTLPLINVTYPQ